LAQLQNREALVACTRSDAGCVTLVETISPACRDALAAGEAVDVVLHLRALSADSRFLPMAAYAACSIRIKGADDLLALGTYLDFRGECFAALFESPSVASGNTSTRGAHLITRPAGQATHALCSSTPSTTQRYGTPPTAWEFGNQPTAARHGQR
jgi:hypothetical protein